MPSVCGGVKRHDRLLFESVLSRAGGAVEVKHDHTGVFYSVDDAETVHPPRPSHSPLLTIAIPAKAFGRPASPLRGELIRGLTGSLRPLYSAGFATSAFRRAWRKPLW